MDKDARLIELNMDSTPPETAIPDPKKTDAEIAERMQKLAHAKEKVFKVIDANFQEYTEMFQELVQIPSVNPSDRFEKDVADHLADLMKKLDMEVTQVEPEPMRVSDLGIHRGTEGEKTLLFYAHLDTVPVGDMSKWDYDPFAATIDKDCIWGRGTKDCKLGLAAALAALDAIKEAGIPLKHNFAIVGAADEETGGHLGIHHMIKEGMIEADWCIYGEGDRVTLTNGARGGCQFEVTVNGKSAHTANKQLGTNAVVHMSRLIPAIDGAVFHDFKPDAVVPGTPVASVNMVQGGFKENVVPDSCKILVDSRFPPGYTPAQVLDTIGRIIAESRAKDPYLGGINVSDPTPRTVLRPYAVDEREPIIKYLSAAVHDVLEFVPKAVGMFASSDARWIYLDAGIPIVNYSLGNSSGHGPNEYVRIQDYRDNIAIYALVALLLLA